MPDLLLSEIVVTPTAGEFVEIHNPTASAIDLSDVYLTDATFAGGGTYYYNIVTGANAGGGGFGDFHARFPDGASIAPGEFQTVSMAGSDDFFADLRLRPDLRALRGRRRRRRACPTCARRCPARSTTRAA